MVCSSADQFTDNHLENNGADVKRLKLEGRSGISTWKWILEYLDQLWNHVDTRECRQQRARRKFPQYLHLHLRLKNTYPRCEFTATAEEAMWRSKRRWWFSTHPTWILRNRKWLAKSPVTQTFSKRLFQSCWTRTTNWSILARSPLHRSYRFSRTTSTPRWYRGENLSLPWTGTSLLWAPSWCSCNLLGIGVPKCTRWRPQRIHIEAYCQVRWRMLGRCSNAVRKGSDDAFDGTEKFESAWWDNSVWSSSTLIVPSSCRKTAVHYWSETRFDVRYKMFVIQTCVTNTCRFDTCQESVEIFERNTRTESLHDDICIETQWLEQDFETHHGIFWRWLGWWSSDEEKHILHTVLRWSISLDEWMSRTGDCCLVQWRIRNVCSWCIVSWVDFRTSFSERDLTIILDTRENRQQHSTRSGNETRSKSQDETHSHEILIHSRFGISETFNDVISQDWCESEWHRNESAGTWAIPQIEINAWHGYWAERDEFTWQMVQWRRVIVEISRYEMMDWTSRTVDTCEQA